jgi:hypothetical protein
MQKNMFHSIFIKKIVLVRILLKLKKHLIISNLTPTASQPPNFCQNVDQVSVQIHPKFGAKIFKNKKVMRI